MIKDQPFVIALSLSLSKPTAISESQNSGSTNTASAKVLTLHYQETKEDSTSQHKLAFRDFTIANISKSQSQEQHQFHNYDQNQLWMFQNRRIVNMAQQNICLDASIQADSVQLSQVKQEDGSGRDQNIQAVTVGAPDGSFLKDSYILQTYRQKYLLNRETESGSGILCQAMAARREHVVWRLVNPKDMVIEVATKGSSTREGSCNGNYQFIDGASEEVKIAQVNTVLIPSLPRFGQEERPSNTFGSVTETKSAASMGDHDALAFDHDPSIISRDHNLDAQDKGIPTASKQLSNNNHIQQSDSDSQNMHVDIDLLMQERSSQVETNALDFIEEGRATLMTRLEEQKPQGPLRMTEIQGASASGAAQQQMQYVPADDNSPNKMQDHLSQTKQVIRNSAQPKTAVCHDDMCEPIPEEIFILVGLGRKDMFDYCRMRIFNTLFRWKEIDEGIREVVWPKLLRVEDYHTDFYRKLYQKLVNFPNKKLDDEIFDDETRKRFKVRTSVEGKMITADEDKLVRVVRAYGIFDPDVFYKQAYVYMTTLLFHYLHDEEDVFYALCWIMTTLGWREHFIEPFPRQNIIATELYNYVTFSLPKLHSKFEEDGALMLRMAIETLYDFVFQNIAIGGERAALPVEVSRRVFELVIFEGYGDESLSRCIVYMLMITQDKVLAMDMGDRFRYIGHGKFIADCFQDQSLFAKLSDLLRTDLEEILLEEQQLSVQENAEEASLMFVDDVQSNNAENQTRLINQERDQQSFLNQINQCDQRKPYNKSVSISADRSTHQDVSNNNNNNDNTVQVSSQDNHLAQSLKDQKKKQSLQGSSNQEQL